MTKEEILSELKVYRDKSPQLNEEDFMMLASLIGNVIDFDDDDFKQECYEIINEIDTTALKN